MWPFDWNVIRLVRCCSVNIVITSFITFFFCFVLVLVFGQKHSYIVCILFIFPLHEPNQIRFELYAWTQIKSNHVFSIRFCFQKKKNLFIFHHTYNRFSFRCLFLYYVSVSLSLRCLLFFFLYVLIMPFWCVSYFKIFSWRRKKK